MTSPNPIILCPGQGLTQGQENSCIAAVAFPSYEISNVSNDLQVEAM